MPLPADLRYKTQNQSTVTTAVVLRVFAKELEAQGFSGSRIDALLVAALAHELRGDGLNLMSLDDGE
jgi:hypothetical protein